MDYVSHKDVMMEAAAISREFGGLLDAHEVKRLMLSADAAGVFLRNGAERVVVVARSSRWPGDVSLYFETTTRQPLVIENAREIVAEWGAMPGGFDDAGAIFAETRRIIAESEDKIRRIRERVVLVNRRNEAARQLDAVLRAIVGAAK